MLYFENDYCEGAHPAILQKLTETNFEKVSGYGTDPYCASAKEKIRTACACPEADVFFISGGTQANSIVIASMLRRWEGVIAAATGHVAGHEAGAIEFTGHKVIGLPQKNGKLDAATVEDFCKTFYAETVVLLSHKKADSYIHIDVEFGEGEGKIPVDSIAKRAEAYKPKEKVTYKMIKEYIEAKYGFKVHTAYIAEVKRNLGLPMYDAPNAVEELKQPRKHPTPEKVEAIKDALRYFAVI